MSIDAASVQEVLSTYVTDFQNISAHLSMKGKTLAEALREQSQYPIWYDIRKAELKKLVKTLEKESDRVRGQKYRHYLETYSRQLTERAINNYIDFDPEYLLVSGLTHAASEMYDKYSAASEAFTKRGFALRDFTSALVNSLHESII